MTYEKLEVWQRSFKLTVCVFKQFSSLKDYGFRDQITRSALSIPSNIAEGWERVTDKEKVRFLSFAKGSCGELKTQLLIAAEIGYIDSEIVHTMSAETEQIAKMLGALMNKLARSS